MSSWNKSKLIFYAHLQYLFSHVHHAACSRHEWAAKNERNVSILFYIYDHEINWKYKVFNLHQNIFNHYIWLVMERSANWRVMRVGIISISPSHWHMERGIKLILAPKSMRALPTATSPIEHGIVTTLGSLCLGGRIR